jgi:hypothetical protein
MRFCFDHGIVESWNNGIVGFLKDIINFSSNFMTVMSLTQPPVSQNPFFQYSNIPIGAKSAALFQENA